MMAVDTYKNKAKVCVSQICASFLQICLSSHQNGDHRIHVLSHDVREENRIPLTKK
jgi:hypothetical protein